MVGNQRAERRKTSGPVATPLLALLLSGLLVGGIGPRAATAQAGADDLTTVDGVITALYASISGGMGEARSRERFMSLFAPDARLIPTNAQAPTGYMALTPEEYWERSMGMLVDIGFTEAEIHRTTEQFGNVTHAFSTYESYREDQGNPDEPFARGINSIQLVWHEGRYWVLTIFWDSERPGNPIPGRYLPGE